MTHKKPEKYHHGTNPDFNGRCVGEHCLVCFMLGRTESLYGEKLKPLRMG